MIKLGLSQKITMGFMLVVTVAVLSIGGVVIQLFHSYVMESRQQSMISRAQDIAAITAPFLGDSGNARGYGAFMRFFDGLAGGTIWITDVEGRLLIATENNKGVTLPSENNVAALKSILQGQTVATEIHQSGSADVLLEIAVPVKAEDQHVVGAVFMLTPITGIKATIHQAYITLLLGWLASLMLALVIGWFISSKLTSPLKKLNASAHEIANGHYGVRTEIRQNDEIGQLSVSFDHMTSQLADNINQLFIEKTKLSDVLESISEGLLLYDGDGQLISANPSALTLLGFESLDQFKNQNETANHQPQLLNAVSQVLVNKTPQHFLLEEINSVLKYTATPFQDKENVIAGVVVFIQDISESENLERMRREFIANVSHELRTPLTMIRGSMEAIRDGTVSTAADVAAFQDLIMNETLILERLITDLLDLSKLESGKLELKLETLHPETIANDAIRVFAPLIKSDHLRISIEASDLPSELTVTGDYDRLRQVLLILLDNAVKYSPGKADILLRIGVKDSDQCVIEVIDHGRGIPAEDLAHIWDRFYRSDKSRGSAIKGTGLGLSIAKKVVELHGGTILAASKYGEGTHMTLSLPLFTNQHTS